MAARLHWCDLLVTAHGCLQALCRVLPLRNFFLLPQNYSSCKSVLVQRFGALLRKTWNPRQFKGQVRDSDHAPPDPTWLLPYGKNSTWRLALALWLQS